MDKEKALEKIKKCLALSQSANEHEAAQALKQAQALMRQHGISDAEVALSDIREHSCAGRTAAKMPGWQAMLANTVAGAFGCGWYLGGDWREPRIRYYGVDNKAELAAYAYDVLLRQVKAARKDYMATVLKRVRLAKNKTYRADEFCKGWILGVQRKVGKFANGEREQALLQQFGDNLGLNQTKTRESTPGGHAKQAGNLDRFLGHEKGKHAQLHHAMGGEDLKRLGAT
ncbi:DUF2786 domain-containing protein [Neisseria shayeganii]|uniref:DUF2786 domain-containing protein n=1 Tax=Neisseria shayeganii TaxID=607712 RepID=A0A7D7SHC9_9NEIS|nr:DUF2786 domain-containing protein [Neisseria shayeganii]QMT39967.1 DUF2786 domain-containing protein [Neisseria shayeganii]